LLLLLLLHLLLQLLVILTLSEIEGEEPPHLRRGALSERSESKGTERHCRCTSGQGAG
jgi:hypothetical protein